MHQKDEHISWVDYLIRNNPYGVNRVLYHYGYFAPHNVGEMYQAVGQMIQEKGSQAVSDLMHEHPDRDILISCKCPSCSQTPYFYPFSGDEDVQQGEKPYNTGVVTPDEKTNTRLKELEQENAKMKSMMDFAVKIGIGILVYKAFFEKSNG